jgi:four helix bundle protein
MTRVKSYRDLDVYQLAFGLQQTIFQISRQFPNEEKFALTSQIRRSSRSIGANLAEAWPRRRYPAHFLSKLTDSDSELSETEHWLLTARECEYISDSCYEDLFEQYRVLGRKLGNMISTSGSWSPPA